MEVHVSWRVAQTATETRNVSAPVIAQRLAGSGHDGEMASGVVGRGIVEKSGTGKEEKSEQIKGDRESKKHTFIGKVVKETDAYDKSAHKEQKLTVIVGTNWS
jgi:hypothetical protein